MTVDGRRVLAWADRDLARRRGRRLGGATIVAGLAGVALGLEAARRGGFFAGARAAPGVGFLIACVLGAMIPPMLGAPQRMFWRADASMVARLPIAGGALWYVAVVRAVRSAILGVVAAAPALAVTAIADGALAARAAVLLGVLALVAALLIPAICLGAAHVVASGQASAAARTLAGGEYQVPSTTLLGALPGAAIGGVVIAVVAASGWLAGRAPGGVAVVIGLGAAAVVAAAAATAAAPHIYPRAMREIAALDRQILAHIDIHPATGLERAVRDRLGGATALVFDRLVRLARRRYPLFALLGAVAALALAGVAIGRPDDGDVWLAILGAVLVATAAWIYRATGQPPLELPRSTATLPLEPAAVARARRATVGLWLAVWAVVPVAVAIARLAS